MMDATVKLIPGTGGCQHITAEIMVNGVTRRIVELREDLVKEDLDTDEVVRIVRANLKAFLKIEAAAAVKAAKPLDWADSIAKIGAKTFKV